MSIEQHWIQVTIDCESQAFEAVADFLFGQGAGGVQELDHGLIGYFNESIDPVQLKNNIMRFFKAIKTIGFNVSDPEILVLPTEDWSEGWRDYFHAIPVTESIVIKPPWETWNGPQPVVIDIMPRMAFGTGSHETTRLCLELLEKAMKPGFRVLDMGTGSGILAIACAKLGGTCAAVEIDEDALENTLENVKMNGVDHQIQILHGSMEVIHDEKFDLIMANINRTVLIDLLPGLTSFCHARTVLILSGLLTGEAHRVEQMLGTLRFHIIESRVLGEWTGLLAGIEMMTKA